MNVVVTRTGFFTRLKNSFVGILIGIVAVLGSMWLLGWNEFRTVKERKGLEEGRAAVVTASLERVDPQLEKKLIYLSGPLVTEQGVSDPEFDLQRNAIALHRDVEMYQWEEKSSTRTEKTAGGGETKTTTYSYSKVWSDDLIDSDSFHKSGYDNPKSFATRSRQAYADDVALGAYRLNSNQVERVEGRRVIRDEALEAVMQDRGWQAEGGYFFRADSPSNPKIGDLRLQFTETPVTPVSLAAAQTGSSFTPHLTSYKTEIDLLETGEASVDLLFEHAQSANTALGWVLRGVGFAVMWIGFGMTLQPLRVLADVIPPVGRFVGALGGMLSFVLAALLAGLTISIAWLFSRPLMVLSGLAIGIGVFMLIGQLRSGRAGAQASSPPRAAPPPPPPPPPRPPPSFQQ